MIRLSQIKGVGVGLASHISFRLPLERFDGFYNEVNRMGNLLGLGAKSVCGFFTHKSKMTSKMAAKPSIF